MYNSVLGFFLSGALLFTGLVVLNYLGLQLMIRTSQSKATKSSGWLSREDYAKYGPYLNSTFGPARFYIRHQKQKITQWLRR